MGFSDRFNHTYTQLLVICLLTFETRDHAWAAVGAIVVSVGFAAIAAAFDERAEKRL